MLAALAALTLVSVGAGQASGVGSFAMFSDPVEYRVEVLTRGADAFPTRVPLRELRPHLSRDARRVVAEARRFIVGETNARLLEGGLEDVAALACALRPDADVAEVRLERRELAGSARPTVVVRTVCSRSERAR